VWLSGENIGEIFELDKNFYSYFAKRKEFPISSVYSPPKLLVYLLEISMSAGAVLAFVQLASGGWKILSSFLFP